MEEIFKDAARNGELDQKTMKEMADALQNMKELGEKDMQRLRKTGGSSGSKIHSGKDRKRS